MTGKQVKHNQVNRLMLSQGHDDQWRVRTLDKPHEVLFTDKDREVAFRWAHKCRKYTRKEPIWADYELEFLADNYGSMPADDIARRLNRSRNALKIIAYRKLNGLNQRSNIFTAHAVAQVLGVSCSKTIIHWMKKGFIKGKRAPFAYGATLCWRFDYEDIVKCLKKRPWLVNLSRMETSFFRSIVKEEFERDPWYNCRDAAPFLGLVDINAVHRYIYRGWLPSLRRPLCGRKGHGSWGWVVRKSAIDAMLVNDPRPARRRHALVKSRHHKMLEEGRPIPVLKEWLLKCPKCRRRVRIIADPNIRSPKVKEMFLQIYTNGKCNHAKKVYIK